MHGREIDLKQTCKPVHAALLYDAIDNNNAHLCVTFARDNMSFVLNVKTQISTVSAQTAYEWSAKVGLVSFQCIMVRLSQNTF